MYPNVSSCLLSHQDYILPPSVNSFLEITLSDHVSPTAVAEDNSLSRWEMPGVNELAYALEPILMVFQEQHLASKDWRSLGFMTTHLNFSNKLILKKLTHEEQVLLVPYLKFVEEQVAMPWQRVCFAAAKIFFKLINRKLTGSHLHTQTVSGN